MAKLIIPRHPSEIRRCNMLSWMRVRVNEEPATGMIVGSPENPFLLYVGKDGTLTQGSLNILRVSFIDYLTDDESVTIFGEAGERTDDDVAHLDAQGRPDLEIGCDAYLVPDFIPFRQRVSGSELETVTFPGAGDREGMRTSLSFGTTFGNADWHCWGRMEKDSGRVFLGYLDDPSLDRWRKHKLVKDGRTIGVEQWPKI